MKKIILIVVGILLGLILVTLIWEAEPSSNNNPNFTPSEFPVNSPAVSVSYDNLTKNPNTIQVSDGMYNLNEATTNPDLGFSFLYSELDNSIYVSLDKLPISETRERASEYLVNLLNISNEVACDLKVYVGVPYAVDANVSGRNLGLSFCPGSEKL